MNPELQQKVVGYLDRLESAAGKASDFAAAEAPEAIREWLLWLTIERFAAAGMLLALATIAGLVARCFMRAYERYQPKTSYDDTAGGIAAATAVSLIVTLGCLIGAGHWTLQGVKVLVAPRFVAIEQVAGLVKDARK